MATTSTALTVANQLVTLLDAALTAPVTPSEPGEVKPPSGYVYLNDIVNGDHVIPTARGASRQRRQEEYDIEVVMETSDRDTATADAAVFALFAEVEDILADDPQLGLSATLPTIVATISSWQRTRHPDPRTQGTRCQIIALVHVEVRLQ